MMETLIHYAPMISLLFFFCVFVGIVVWLAWPGTKQKLQVLANIPLQEDNHGRP